MATDSERRMGKLTVTYRIISVANDIEASDMQELGEALRDLPAARLERIARALEVISDIVDAAR